MRKLTAAERRRVFQLQEAARQAMLARMSGSPPSGLGHGRNDRWRQRLLRTALVVTLCIGGVALYEFVEFDPPSSLVEAFLPRR